jgi:hypothetical protein
VIEHASEACALQRKDPQLSKEFLLANSLTKCGGGQFVGLAITRRRLDDWVLWAVWWVHVTPLPADARFACRLPPDNTTGSGVKLHRSAVISGTKFSG